MAEQKDMTNRKLFNFLGAGEILTILIIVGTGLMAFQSLANEQEYITKEADAMWQKQTKMAEKINKMQVHNAEIKSDVKSNKETLVRIEAQNGKILEMLRDERRN